jgi:hypothetical protein
VQPNTQSTSANSAYPYEGGLAITNSPVHGGTNTICVAIVDDGFQVGYSKRNSIGYEVNRSNVQDKIYNYIAWR